MVDGARRQKKLVRENSLIIRPPSPLFIMICYGIIMIIFSLLLLTLIVSPFVISAQ